MITDHTNHFISALCEKFEEYLIVVPDHVPYFHASVVTDREVCDGLDFVTLPSYLPELSPVEEYRR